jgi:Tfp pilus assembly protein PilX
MNKPVRLVAMKVQRGAALLVGLIFLVVLSLVAVLAMKGTLMEMRMINNVSAHEQAFEFSETVRMTVAKLFNENATVSGWPIVLMGGDKVDTLFGTLPAGCTSSANIVGSTGLSCQMIYATTVRKDASTGLPVNLYAIAYSASEKTYDPTTWKSTSPEGDMKISLCSVITSGCIKDLVGRVWVRPDGSSIVSGSQGGIGTAYGVLGASLSGSTNQFFEIFSEATVSGNGRVTTHSQYKQVVGS